MLIQRSLKPPKPLLMGFSVEVVAVRQGYCVSLHKACFGSAVVVVRGEEKWRLLV
jgi:hypothetical protein